MILQTHAMDILQTLVNPLEECDDMGIQLYATTKQLISFFQRSFLILTIINECEINQQNW